MNKFSSTKSVFLLMALTTCYAFLVGKVNEQAYMGVVMMVFMSYYKGDKGVDKTIDNKAV